MFYKGLYLNLKKQDDCPSHLFSSLPESDMKPEWGRAFFHVATASCLCVATIYVGIFDSIFVEVGYEHYAEVPVASLPTFLAMPFNLLINLTYMILGVYWLQKNASAPYPTELWRAHYMKDVFACVALIYGPVQWLRIWTQMRPTAVLDQWLTLPIFVWPVAWCLSLHRDWAPWLLLRVDCLSLSSYGLALLHPQGFEVALGAHVLAAVGEALHTHRQYGSVSTATYLALGILSCMGFVVLKLYDHQLAQWRPFQHLTGHFWSKVCDVLQFHFAFLFLTNLNTCQKPNPKGKMC